jgi:hypothetical protein
MSRFDGQVDVLFAAMGWSCSAGRVARMARFGVRSGSLEGSVEGVIPQNEAV